MLLKELGEHRNCLEKHRLYNDLITAALALTSALNRKGSVGCHFRADSQPESQIYRIIIENRDGTFSLSKEPV